MTMIGQNILTGSTSAGQRVLRRTARFCPPVVLAPFLVMVLAGVDSIADDKQTAAADAAVQWLALVDSGQYAESWFQASNDFRGAASKEQWVHALNTVRVPLGKLQSRNLRSATSATKLPNTRPGEYVVLQYDTEYEKASHMAETVAMVLEKNGQWKLTGYYIKRQGQ